LKDGRTGGVRSLSGLETGQAGGVNSGRAWAFEVASVALAVGCAFRFCNSPEASPNPLARVPSRVEAAISLRPLALSPKAVILDLGEIYQFNAVSARGASPVPGAIRFSASEGEITPTGQFTAPRVEGPVYIVARDPDDNADTAVVTVVAPGDPYFEDDFETCSLRKSANARGFQWRDSQGHPGESPVVSRELARSGRCSLKFTFLPGPAGDDAWSEQRFRLGKKMSEIYLQWYQYYPSGREEPFVGPRFHHRDDTGPDNNKYLRLWDEDYGQYRVKLGFSTMPIGNGDSKLITEFGTNRKGVGPRRSHFDPRAISDARRGRWLKIQVHVRLATAANNDGVIEMWVDGVKTISNQRLPIYPSGGVGNYLRHGYLMGWANSGFAATGVTFIDDVIISAVPIL
jgi:hypothetical protein